MKTVRSIMGVILRDKRKTLILDITGGLEEEDDIETACQTYERSKKQSLSKHKNPIVNDQ